MSPLKKYHVEWDCPHCGNSHNWWWEDEFEAFAEDESDMLCDRCDTLVRCVGDGHGFYTPVKPKDDHTRLLELEERVDAVHGQCFDAINRLSKRLLKLETQRVELAKEEEESSLDLIHGAKPPFHARLREGCQFSKEELPPEKLASVLRFIAVEIERMTDRVAGVSFTISNEKVAAKLRELAADASVEDYIYDPDHGEEDDYCPPEKGDMWVSDDDPTVMKIFTGVEWLPVQQDEL